MVRGRKQAALAVGALALASAAYLVEGTTTPASSVGNAPAARAAVVQSQERVSSPREVLSRSSSPVARSLTARTGARAPLSIVTPAGPVVSVPATPQEAVELTKAEAAVIEQDLRVYQTSETATHGPLCQFLAEAAARTQAGYDRRSAQFPQFEDIIEQFANGILQQLSHVGEQRHCPPISGNV